MKTVQVTSHELADKINFHAMDAMLKAIPDFKAKKPPMKIMDKYLKLACAEFNTTFHSYVQFCKRANDVQTADEFNPYEI